MTAMDKKVQKSEHERLKQELRRLKRSNAPWYFESALHQRLHGGRPSRAGLSPYRIPAVVSLSLGVTVLLAVGSYFLLVNTDLFTRLPGNDQADPKSVDTVRSGEERIPAVVPAVTLTPGGTPSPAVLRGTPVPIPPEPSPSAGRGDMTVEVAADSVRRDTMKVRPAGGTPGGDSARRDTMKVRPAGGIPGGDSTRRDTVKVRPGAGTPGRDSTRREPVAPADTSRGGNDGGTP